MREVSKFLSNSQQESLISQNQTIPLKYKKVLSIAKNIFIFSIVSREGATECPLHTNVEHACLFRVILEVR